MHSSIPPTRLISEPLAAAAHMAIFSNRFAVCLAYGRESVSGAALIALGTQQQIFIVVSKVVSGTQPGVDRLQPSQVVQICSDLTNRILDVTL